MCTWGEPVHCHTPSWGHQQMFLALWTEWGWTLGPHGTRAGVKAALEV